VAPRRAPILTEDHWQAILRAADPLFPADPDRARREIEHCLHNFDVLRQPPEIFLLMKPKKPKKPKGKNVRRSKPKEEWRGVNKLLTQNLSALRKEWQQVDKRLTELADIYRWLKRITPWTVPDPEWPQRNLLALKPLRQQAEAMVKEYDARLRALQARRNPAREWLFGRLFQIWTDCFDGKLAVTTSRGKPPSGPLVRFVRAVLTPLTLTLWEHDLPNIRDRVRQERRRRAAPHKPSVPPLRSRAADEPLIPPQAASPFPWVGPFPVPEPGHIRVFDGFRIFVRREDMVKIEEVFRGHVHLIEVRNDVALYESKRKRVRSR
jgi:hypothetical protein